MTDVGGVFDDGLFGCAKRPWEKDVYRQLRYRTRRPTQFRKAESVVCRCERIENLVANGADVRKTGVFGSTPLDIAVQNSRNGMDACIALVQFYSETEVVRMIPFFNAGGKKGAFAFAALAHGVAETKELVDACLDTWNRNRSKAVAKLAKTESLRRYAGKMLPAMLLGNSGQLEISKEAFEQVSAAAVFLLKQDPDAAPLVAEVLKKRFRNMAASAARAIESGESAGTENFSEMTRILSSRLAALDAENDDCGVPVL